MSNPFTQPDYTIQSGDAYKALIDAAIEIVNKTAGAFNPHAQTVPDMTLRVDAGTIFNPITRARSDVSAQSTGTITAPSVNPRKDIVCVGILTGTVSVITGAEAGSPTDPAITADLIPIARITLQTSTTTITDAITDDIRELGNLGLEASAVGLKNIANAWTKTQSWAKGADVASDTALPVLTDGNSFDVTGTTTIATIATLGIGTVILLQFDGILTLTHSADLFLPGAADITTAAGDIGIFEEYASGDWRCMSYQVAASAPGAGGIIVQVVNTQDGAVATGATTIPDDDTIPQITEGDEYMTRTITPTNASNILQIDVVAAFSPASGYGITALFKDAVANALAGIFAQEDRNGYVFTHTEVAGTTSQITFRVRCGAQSAGTSTFNGIESGSRDLGGVMASSITIKEIKV